MREKLGILIKSKGQAKSTDHHKRTRVVSRMAKGIRVTPDYWVRIRLVVCSLVLVNTLAQDSSETELTFLESAVAKGAVCLDGGPPGYYFQKGFGDGANSWVIFLAGGGWCGGMTCSNWIQNKRTYAMPKSYVLPDIVSQNQAINPDFYNWNRAAVVYCDGASFMGDVEGVDPTWNITRRGMRIFNAVMEDFIAKGMGTAENVILSGTSAGGLAAILHCDMFRSSIPDAKTVKCVSDSGFFLAGTCPNLPGFNKREHRFDDYVAKHEIAKFLPETCKSRMNSSKCMFPQNMVRDIETPLFLVESSFDYFQMLTGLDSGEDPHKWTQCVGTMTNCTNEDIQNMKDFRSVFMKTLQETIGTSPNRGMFVYNCIAHTHICGGAGWNHSPSLGNKNIQQAIGDWYFNRSPVYEIDTGDVMPTICS